MSAINIEKVHSDCMDSLWDLLTRVHMDGDDAQIVLDDIDGSLRSAIRRAANNEAARDAETRADSDSD